MHYGTDKDGFLEAVRKANLRGGGAFLGLPVERVQYTTYRDEGDSRSGRFCRTFFVMDDGTVMKELTSKGFARATPDETRAALALDPRKGD